MAENDPGALGSIQPDGVDRTPKNPIVIDLLAVGGVEERLDAGVSDPVQVKTRDLTHTLPTSDASDRRGVDLRVTRPTTPTMDSHADDQLSPKSTYERKLKEVMERAREHAKKIANERDEARKQLEDREQKIAHMKQLMATATASVQTKESVIKELQEEGNSLKIRISNLELQLKAMETFYSSPPTDFDTDTVIAVTDTDGLEWIQLKDLNSQKSHWWPKPLVPQISSPSVILSVANQKRLETALSRLSSQLDSKTAEFDAYKKKAQLLLSEQHSGSAPSPTSPAADLSYVRKNLELKEELNRATARSTNLEARAVDCEKRETLLRSELVELSDAIKQLQIQCNELRETNASLVSQLASIADMSSRKDITTVSSRRDQETSPVNLQPVIEDTHVEMYCIPSVSVETQTFLVEEQTAPTTKPVPVQPVNAPVHTFNPFPSSSDAIALPLRHKIRDLMDELEQEQAQHKLTQRQLEVVKQEFRKLQSDVQFEKELADPAHVKLEYMRNVGRKFMQLIPLAVPEEFESLLPIVLPFFQLSDEECSALISRRNTARADRVNGGFKLW